MKRIMPDLNDLIGKQFEWHARGPNSYDCQGLAIEVFKRYGINFPDKDISGSIAKTITETLHDEISYHLNVLRDWEEIKKPESPCLVILKGHSQFANHLGVCIGQGRFIHVLENKHGGAVCVSRFSDPIWRLRIVGYYKPTR